MPERVTDHLVATGVGEGLRGYPTYRERRAARAERLRGWAAKREASASAVLQSHEVYRGDTAFNTQPGRIPLRSRVIAQDERAFESLHKAESMASRADGIESQMRGAIYSDDPDAIEALTGRIAGLEAERDRVKAYNASCRKGSPDLAVLDDAQRQQLAGLARIGSVFIGKGGQFPGYHLTNLSGNVARQRGRLEQLQRQTAPSEPDLIGCDSQSCTARFIHVPAREFPTLCLEHAQGPESDLLGWTPSNSVD